MGWMRRVRGSLSNAGGTFDEESRFHIDQRIEEYIRSGMTVDEARQAALKRFGSIALAADRSADANRFRWLDDFRRDLGYGVRMLSRSPGFALLAVLCLTLGIGANAAVFSWIEGILLRPYPLVVDQDRMFAVTGTNRGGDREAVSWPDWLDLERSSTLVESLIGEKITGTTLSVGDRADRAPGSMVSANYFDALGVHPILGRAFIPGEDVGRSAHPVTVISYQAWQDRYHGDPQILGKTQMLNGLPFTIVGVAPDGFYGTFVGYAFQLWVPASMQPQFNSGTYVLEDRSARWLEGFVRLKRGVTIDQAQAELSAIMARLEHDYPDTNLGRGIRLYPLWATPFNGATSMLAPLEVALVVVLAVLLIACANVGNLLLVRAFARQQEMTIRMSIGAGRSRLVRQLLTEGLILAVISGAGGFLLARWLRDAIAMFTPPRNGIVLRFPGQLDWRVLALSTGVCLVSTLVFGLVPAVMSSNVDLADALRSQSGSVVGSRRAAWVRSTLVVLQMALSFVLLVGAGLVIKSVQAMRTASPGFQTDGLLTTTIDAFTAGYDAKRARVFQDELMERVRAIPGVQSAVLSRMTPFSYASAQTSPIAVDGYDAPRDQQPTAEYNSVAPGFFQTMGIPLVGGRDFRDADDEGAAPVAIVDEAMAAQFWRGADPVGSRLQVKGQWRQVVGVVRRIRTRSFNDAQPPYFYLPLRQSPAPVVGLQIRTALGPGAVRPPLVREIHALDSNIAPGEIITMREQLERTTASQLVALTMLTVFGGLALVLAAIGLYGVMAATVAQGARQLALRMARGAETRDVMRLVLGRGLVLTAIGVAAGAATALATTRLMGYLLYQVSPRDPMVFAGTLAIVAASAAAACFVPAWRATRTDPVQALRA
ncbi:MAG TPA: ABC transporter permease [Vicinamibacterales bacterium]|nr:ABC transporter permease [Vicinamibacterales bacterium]